MPGPVTRQSVGNGGHTLSTPAVAVVARLMWQHGRSVNEGTRACLIWQQGRWWGAGWSVNDGIHLIRDPNKASTDTNPDTNPTLGQVLLVVESRLLLLNYVIELRLLESRLLLFPPSVPAPPPHAS